mmetsp:Transcript_35696/g.42626  ORF Transcript_35696/g.42626 Transcript_35696/m.42626 type:complete len:120 (+) Transcript_35696:37-396(+)
MRLLLRFQFISATITFACLISVISFSPQHITFRSDPTIISNILKLSSSSNDDDNEKDPTKVWTAEIADAIQNAVTYSPLNEGKKALVKMLAGEYDSPVVRAKLMGLIEDEPVLMLSFVK